MNKPQRTQRLPGLLKNGLPDLHATSKMLSVANGTACDLRVSVVRRSEANRTRSTTGLTLQQRRPALFDESSIRGSTLVA